LIKQVIAIPIPRFQPHFRFAPIDATSIRTTEVSHPPIDGLHHLKYSIQNKNAGVLLLDTK
jgi:hypothetical protein